MHPIQDLFLGSLSYVLQFDMHFICTPMWTKFYSCKKWVLHMDPFNALSTATTARKIPPLKEAPPAKVMSCALVASIELEKDLDAAKQVTRGAGIPSTKMARWSAMVCGHLGPHDDDRPSPTRQGSPCT
jgi:hypothetical protein